MRNRIERIALLCALAGAPMIAAAQTAYTDDPAAAAGDPAQTGQQTGQTAPAAPATPDATTAPATPDATTARDATGTATAPAGGEAAPARPDGQPVEGQIVLQSADSILATDLIGLTVFSATGEKVGDINDVIVKLDGAVEGVVIGVGGFLGIGEKDVAIELGQIQLTPREEGGMRLVLNATRADLEAAPAFKTAAEQQFEAEAEQMQQQQGGGLAPAPAAGN